MRINNLSDSNSVETVNLKIPWRPWFYRCIFKTGVKVSRFITINLLTPTLLLNSQRDWSLKHALAELPVQRLSDWLTALMIRGRWGCANEDTPRGSLLDVGKMAVAFSRASPELHVVSGFPRPSTVTAEWRHLVGELPRAVPRPQSDFLMRVCTPPIPCFHHPDKMPCTHHGNPLVSSI